MSAQDANNGRRERLGFVKSVEQYIAPLLIGKGFICTEQTAYSVKFQSPKVKLTVRHDPISYELELVYARRADPSERYTLSDMLDTVLGIAHKEQTYFQASEHDRVVYCIKAIADYLQKYGDKVLIGDPTVYQQIREATRPRNEAYTKQVVQQPVRQAAEDAWQKHDYAKVRELYERIEDDLTPVERRAITKTCG